jgi:sugar phosphate isomerase/epimerase
MPRLSMNEMTTYRWTFEEDVARYAAAGFDAIGVWRQKLSDFGEEKGIELLGDSGLAVSNLLWAGGFTGSDGRNLRDSIDDAAEAIHLAADMRAACLVVYSGGRAGHTHSHARRLVTDALREILPLAEDLGVTLAIEPMHPECAGEFTFLACLESALAMLDSLDHPSLKLAFDTYHLGFEPTCLTRLAALAPRVAIVHLGDGKLPRNREQNRSPLGEGVIPLKEIISALEQAGYDGFYDVELIGEDIETADYYELLAQSKQAFSQLLGAPQAR